MSIQCRCCVEGVVRRVAGSDHGRVICEGDGMRGSGVSGLCELNGSDLFRQLWPFFVDGFGPDTNGVIVTSRDELVIVGSEGDRVYSGGMTLEWLVDELPSV